MEGTVATRESQRIGELRVGRIVESDGRYETGSDSGRRTGSCNGMRMTTTKGAVVSGEG